MIPVYFSQQTTLGYDDGTTQTLLPLTSEHREGHIVFDSNRVYLALEETLQRLRADCLRSGKPQPTILSHDIFKSLPKKLRHVSDYLSGRVSDVGAEVRICLINGGGGGLGDGILFAPALAILANRLRQQTGAIVALDVFSMLPLRSASVLTGMPCVRVKPLPLSLAAFMAYDAYVDFSGMLQDVTFATTHMTDFALQRMGIDPTTVAAEDKEPFLALPPVVPAEVQASLAMARAAAKDRALVAVIFKSSYTRSMPEEQAATLIRQLAEAHLPVLLMSDTEQAEAFRNQFNLQDRVLDLSPASHSFTNYMSLLAGLDAIVTVDTSAVHIGAALRKPTVGLFNSIDKALRIAYSPTVRGIQLTYQGRHCRAPCGLSKSLAFVEGELPTGSRVRLECGYACAEAVDKEAILAETVRSLNELTATDDLQSRQQQIRQTMIDRLHAHPAPCWATLAAPNVVTALNIVMQETSLTEMRCPMCGSPPPHAFQGHLHEHTRLYYCGACRGGFARRQGAVASSETDQPSATPLLSQEEKIRISALLKAVIPAQGHCLVFASERWRSMVNQWFSDPTQLTLMEWPVHQGKAPGADAPDCNAIIVLHPIDDETNPAETLARLLMHLNPGGVVMLLSRNRQALQRVVPKSRLVAQDRSGWTERTHRQFYRRLGLAPLWIGTTPVPREMLQHVADALPPLHIQPPSHRDLVVRLDGPELSGYVGNFMADVLRPIEGYGRFVLSLARKTPKE
jgi:hypothetical protein